MSVVAMEDWPFPDEVNAARQARRGGLAVTGLAIVLCLWPTSVRDGARRPSPPSALPPADSNIDWPALAGSVRDRFALAAAVGSCQHTENLYGFDLLLAAVPEPHRAELLAARTAGEGTPAAAATDPDECSAGLDKLAAADDRLVVLAEKVKRDQP